MRVMRVFVFFQVCVERGWNPWHSGEADEYGGAGGGGGGGGSWNLWWRHSFPPAVYRRLRGHQVVNHIPRANGICKKDSLARSLQKLKHVFGGIFDFVPSTFLLPCDYTKLVAEYTRLLYEGKNDLARSSSLPSSSSSQSSSSSSSASSSPSSSSPISSSSSSTSSSVGSDSSGANIWICKPIGSSQGRGITLFQDLHELSYASSAVVQRYIGNPLQIGGYKCDVRLYVLVTSFLPLTVYTYTEGIVRFGTEKYSLTALDNVFSHLTNTSLNKTAPGYRLEKERVGSGCKWTLAQLRRYLATSGMRDWLLWQRVHVLIALTLVSQVGSVPQHQGCFELYGFDILIDDSSTPWLLEVNRCPSLSYDCEVDRVVKKPMLHHLFDLMGLPKVHEATSRLLRPPCFLILNKELREKRSGDGFSNSNSSDTENSLNYPENGKRWPLPGCGVCEECQDEVAKMAERLCDYGCVSGRKLGDRSLVGVGSSFLRGQNSRSYLQTLIRNAQRSNKLSLKTSTRGAKYYDLSGPPIGETSRRRRSLTSLPSESFKGPLPEELCLETFTPVAFNTTFNRVRRQFAQIPSNIEAGVLGSTSTRTFSSASRGTRPIGSFSRRERSHRTMGPTAPPSAGRSTPCRRLPNRCGEWLRSFPYNAATLHASRDPLFMKTLVAELQKYKRLCEKVFRDHPNADDDCLSAFVQKLLWKDSVVWLPQK
ncbi:uncharacterized protein LOC143040825 [Oratosquilla oratoria]|uniref:uncharacterized protein LOC143040825 n=1 Tax=Oratosquilla oratoria TaxID=337810 RepID=UPI003F759561